jgi:hypothetical protein
MVHRSRKLLTPPVHGRWLVVLVFLYFLSIASVSVSADGRTAEEEWKAWVYPKAARHDQGKLYIDPGGGGTITYECVAISSCAYAGVTTSYSTGSTSWPSSDAENFCTNIVQGQVSSCYTSASSTYVGVADAGEAEQSTCLETGYNADWCDRSASCYCEPGGEVSQALLCIQCQSDLLQRPVSVHGERSDHDPRRLSMFVGILFREHP